MIIHVIHVMMLCPSLPTQEQYEEEGVEWETVPVEFNQTLMDTFHKVSTVTPEDLKFARK